MGLFSSIFGGGSTKVTQTAKNTTNVDVTAQIANVVDLTVLAEAMKQLGTSLQTGLTDSVKGAVDKLSSVLSQSQQVGLLASLADIQERVRTNDLMAKALGYVKYAALAGAAYWLWRRF